MDWRMAGIMIGAMASTIICGCFRTERPKLPTRAESTHYCELPIMPPPRSAIASGQHAAEVLRVEIDMFDLPWSCSNASVRAPEEAAQPGRSPSPAGRHQGGVRHTGSLSRNAGGTLTRSTC